MKPLKNQNCSTAFKTFSEIEELLSFPFHPLPPLMNLRGTRDSTAAY
jgi:hypothetical protein